MLGQPGVVNVLFSTYSISKLQLSYLQLSGFFGFVLFFLLLETELMVAQVTFRIAEDNLELTHPLPKC